MKKIWAKHKIKILVLAYVGATALLFYVSVEIMGRSIVSKSDEIQKKILDQEIEKQRISKIAPMEENYAFFQDNKKATEVMLNQDEAADYIKKMENIAQETGNAVSFKVEDAVAAKKPASQSKGKNDNAEKSIRDSLGYDSYIAITIDLKGDYDNLVAFINKLENTRNYVNILSLESKAEVDQSEDAKPRPADIFAQVPVANKPAENKIEKKIIHSTINAVIYTKK